MTKLTQHEWSLLLIAGFRADWTLIRVLCLAAGEPPWPKGRIGKKHTKEQIDELFSQAKGLHPSIQAKNGRQVSIAKPVRGLLAERAPLAADALWDGDEEKARRLMTVPLKRSQTVSTREGRTTVTSAGRTMRKNIERTKFISARSLDKGHDWHTVK